MAGPLGYLHGSSILYELEDPETQIGRAETNDIVLTSSRSVSSVHAKIVIHPKKKQSARLVDLNSMNGCFVNEFRIHDASQTLQSGDVIRFGYDSDTYKFYFPEDVPHSLLGEPEQTGKTFSDSILSGSEGARRKREDLEGQGVSAMFTGFKELKQLDDSYVPPMRRSRSLSRSGEMRPAGMPTKRPNSASSTRSRTTPTNVRRNNTTNKSDSLDLMPSLRSRAGIIEPRHSHTHQHTREASPPWRDPSVPRHPAREIPVSVHYPKAPGEHTVLRVEDDRQEHAANVSRRTESNRRSMLREDNSAYISSPSASFTSQPGGNGSFTNEQYGVNAEAIAPIKKVFQTHGSQAPHEHNTPSTQFGASPEYNFPSKGSHSATSQAAIVPQEFEDSLNAATVDDGKDYGGTFRNGETFLQETGESSRPLVSVAPFELHDQPVQRYSHDNVEKQQQQRSTAPAGSADKHYSFELRSNEVRSNGDGKEEDAVGIRENNGTTRSATSSRSSSRDKAMAAYSAPSTPDSFSGGALLKYIEESKQENAALRAQVDQLARMVQQTHVQQPNAASKAALAVKRRALHRMTQILDAHALLAKRAAFNTWAIAGSSNRANITTTFNNTDKSSADNLVDAADSQTTVRARCMSPPRPQTEPPRGFYISTCSSRAKNGPEEQQQQQRTLKGSRDSLFGSRASLHSRGTSEMPPLAAAPAAARNSAIFAADVGVQTSVEFPTPRSPRVHRVSSGSSDMKAMSTPRSAAPPPFAEAPSNTELLLQDVAREVSSRGRKLSNLAPAIRQGYPTTTAALPKRTWSRSLAEEVGRVQRIAPTTAAPAMTVIPQTMLPLTSTYIPARGPPRVIRTMP